LLGVLLILLFGAPAIHADEDPFEAARAEFMRASTELATGDANDSRALRDYPLYPYLQSARLRRELTRAVDWSAADERAKQFLEFYDVEPVGRALRQAWLESLARREQWSALVAHYQTGASNAALRCQYLRARIALARNDDAALEPLEPAAVEQWLTPQQLPGECERVFEWLRDRGAMTNELIEQRVRRLLDNGRASFARVIARRLPAARAAPLEQWADLIEQPARALDAILSAPREQKVEAAALLDAWTRLSRANPAAALERYEPLLDKVRLDAGQKSRVALALALGLAWDRQPEALAMFARVAPADLDDDALAWRARAALWADAWSEVETAIAAMSERQRAETRWRYWSARAAERRGDAELAETLYASVLANDNFYSAHAAARLGELAEPHPQPLALDRDLVERIAAYPFFVRARELLRADMRTEAVTEWVSGFAALDQRARTQAVHLAARWGWHDVSIASATRQMVFYDYELLYPQPYEPQVQAAAALTQIELPLLYGVIRQESLFRADAVSPAGALGLAQLMPDTARIVARQRQEPAPGVQDLLDPKVSVRLGASHLRSLLDRFDGQTVVAVAGYNAGALAAARWLPSEPIDADIWIENIPYNETREYVQRVLWHSVVFAWLRTGRAQETAAWLTAVVPRPLEASNGP
jgi:soluble lytic murein transglycosylase